MASGIVQPTILPPPPPVPADSREREQIIQRQLARTGLQVRLVDLANSIAVWIIGVLLLFIGCALVDHFIGLGSIGRCAALAVLVGCSLWYLAITVAPLLVRAINPEYAARTIEEATPTLKNSLINFLLLRHDRSRLKEIVYQAVEKQAATDIATVPIEAAVDRSRLIHAGYVLCVVLAIFAGYKILSPKDPFQTVARVLAPWAEIARPSRVQISEVEPGSAEIYYGQMVPIFATVRGVREGDKVTVRYTTADGQTIDAPIEMKLSAGNRYECELPPGRSGPAEIGGLLQNATYRIVAGDAESFPYRLSVVSAPTIIVDRLEYQYPAYTNKAAESVAQQGDMKGLEGTKVTVHTVANQAIKSAWIELDPTTGGAGEIVALAAEGDQASGMITLQLKPDRQTPWHATYQLRFYNERGQRSHQPILHKIEVLRDLPPEVQILRPERLRVEVPEDGEETIEVRAVDPDFGLSKLRMEGTTAGRPLVSIDLLPDVAGSPPQITVPYAFRPGEHKLKAGDELRYAAVAEDNRTRPLSGQPEPNVTRTKEYTLVVTAPRNKQGGKGSQQQPSKDQPQNQKSDEKKADKNQQQGAKKNDGQKGQQPDQKDQRPMNTGGQDKQEQGNKPNEQQQGEQQKNQPQQGGENKQQNGEKQQGGESKQQDGQQQSGQQQNGGQQGDQQKQPQQGDQQQGGAQSGGSQQSGGQGTGQQEGQSGAKGDSSGSSQQGYSTGNGAEGNQSTSQGNKSGQGASQPKGGQKQGDQQGQENGGSKGQGGADSGKAQHDGQAIERIWEKLKNHSQNDQQQRGDKQQPKDSQQEGKQPSDQDAGSQPQGGGASGAQNQNVPNAGRPEGNDQKLNDQAQGNQGKGKQGDANQRLPDDKEGQNPSDQASGGNKGGAPRGGSKTDKGEKSSASKGDERDPGAGKNSDEGAGQASADKTGSGVGQDKNRDTNKDLQPDGNKPEQGDASAGSNSKRQSDSKGGESGDQNGGGKKGPGQSGAQEGNDSAGTKSAADQGAGKANETGGGETGSKAGEQQKAAGATGKRGDETGDGSASRAGNEGPSPGGKGSPQSDRNAAKSQQKGNEQQGSNSGQQPVGGKDGGRERFQEKTESSGDQEADAANLEYARKATEMVLKHLKDEEHNPDPELLDKLGWSKEDLAEFLRRWDALQKSADQSPAGKRDLDEALKSLGLRDPANRRRAGGTANDNQRDVRDAGNRSAPPPRYRDLFDAFRKGAARSSP